MNTIRYALSLRLLHWIIAALVIALVTIGLWMVNRAQADLWDDLTNTLYAWHKALGFAVLLLMIARLIVRLISNTPPPAASLSPALRRISRGVHALLYLLLLAVPLLGWAGVSAFPALIIVEGINLPSMPGIPEDQSLAKRFFEIHSTLAIALAALALLHIAAAIKHRWINKDEVFDRMRL